MSGNACAHKGPTINVVNRRKRDLLKQSFSVLVNRLIGKSGPEMTYNYSIEWDFKP